MNMVLPSRWNVGNLRATLHHPKLIERELRIWISRITHPLYNQRQQQRYKSYIDVTERDWDNLILLDACRLDYFREDNIFDRPVESVVSKGSTSKEFIWANFKGRELHDTVYVTANPYVEQLSDEVFHAVENLLIDGWEDDLGTVPPETVVEAARAAHEQYPNKRLIVHFMQPHQPYIGPTAATIRDRVGLNDGYNKFQCVNTRDTKIYGKSWFGSVIQGDITQEELRQLYDENVEIALGHAKDCLSQLNGKTVISADHGELLGERLDRYSHRLYGHPPNCYAPELRIVPWLVIPGETRREITTGEPSDFARLNQQVANDRLQALGYVAE